MSVDVASIQAGTGLLLICSGEVTSKDLIDAKKRLKVSPQRIHECRYAIVDFVLVSELKLSASEVRELAEQDIRIAALLVPGLVVAVVAPTEATFGLSRMWQVLAETTGWETTVVRTREDGQDWIQQKVRERFGIDAMSA
jgi:hypothetical protein